MKGFIAESFIYDRELSWSEKIVTGFYLKDKWGLYTSLIEKLENYLANNHMNYYKDWK